MTFENTIDPLTDDIIIEGDGNVYIEKILHAIKIDERRLDSFVLDNGSYLYIFNCLIRVKGCQEILICKSVCV